MPPRRKITSQKQYSKKQRKYSSLLIIECDANKLQSQSINIAQKINEIFSILPLIKHRFIQIYSKEDLLSKFADLSKEKQEYDIIILVGHSILDSFGNPVKIKFASDYSIRWNILPTFLRDFKSKCLILATCKGGHFLPSREMFDGLPTLIELFGSPVITNQKQISILKFIILYLIATSKFDKDIWFISQFFNYFITGGIVLRHTRKEYKENKPVQEVQQFIYEWLRDLFKKLK